MAITIHQQPAEFCAIGSKNIITSSSTNSGNEGFMYVVRVLLPSGVTEFLQPPNSNGYLVFDPTETWKPAIRNTPNSENYDLSVSIHANTASTISTTEIPTIPNFQGGVINSTIVILEGWIVGGIFTTDEDSVENIETNVYNVQFSMFTGLNYNVRQAIGMRNGDQSRLMSDRLPSTHFFPNALAIGLNQPNVIYTPVYESDWGAWGCVFQEGYGTKVRLSILPTSGPPVQQIHEVGVSGGYENMQIYPANLNASTIPDIIKPQEYPNWKAIYFQILNEDDEQVSMTYVMYNAERFGGCLGIHNKIRLAWVGRRGGWEYFNFTKKSNESYVTEKKIAQRSIGNAADVSSSALFTFNSFDETTFIVDMKVEKYLTANSDYLSDGEFEFLKGLFLSKQVHWVHDDGTHTPVIVQADGYEVKREHGGATKYNQEIKLLIAQEQFN